MTFNVGAIDRILRIIIGIVLIADSVLVPPDRVDEESSSPEVLPNKIAFALSMDPSQMDRALGRERNWIVRQGGRACSGRSA